VIAAHSRDGQVKFRVCPAETVYVSASGHSSLTSGQLVEVHFKVSFGG
jgi:hypothetical protein